MSDITSSPAWLRGIATAEAGLAAAAKEKREVPVSRTAAAISILASPHIKNWPVECREWLFDKCTRWPKKETEHPHHAISRAELGLEEL